MSPSNHFSATDDNPQSTELGTADVSLEIARHLGVATRFKNDLEQPSFGRLLPTAWEFAQNGQPDLVTNPNSNLSRDPAVPRLRHLQPPCAASSVVSIQKWEGYVTEVQNGTFFARLTDVSGGGAEEEAEFAVSELSRDDLPLLEPGAGFYWSIGYQTDLTD